MLLVVLMTGSDLQSLHAEETAQAMTQESGAALGSVPNEEIQQELPDATDVPDVGEEGNSAKEIEPFHTEEMTQEAPAVQTQDQQEPVAEERMIEAQTEQARTSYIDITRKEKLELRYDDRYSLSTEYSRYKILEIETQKVNSYQVCQGKKSDQADKSVVELQKNTSDQLIATGTGRARITLVPADAYAQAKKIQKGSYQGEQMVVQALQIDVTVKRAPLTLMLLAGQSNMEGRCSWSIREHPEDSIACEPGQVYSTYAPKSSSRATLVTGLTGIKACTTQNVKEFIAGGLGKDNKISQAGTRLSYPLEILTTEGTGKTGPDSGLAYEWNRLTGQKVWTVNAAYGGSSIMSWEVNGTNYQRALAVFQAAEQTLNAEVEAGHYGKKNVFLYWLQGEQDRAMSDIAYERKFSALSTNMKKACGIEQIGLISVRAHALDQAGPDDVSMNGPRIAQYRMTNSTKNADIHMVSNENERWVTDKRVQQYFQSRYKNGKLDYPLRANTTLKGLPTTVSQVHADVHYSQVAHNENGRNAAYHMRQILKANSQQALHVRLLYPVADQSQITLQCGDVTPIVFTASPLSKMKQVKIKVNARYFTYDANRRAYRAIKGGKTRILLNDSQGKTLAEYAVRIKMCATPKLQSIENQKNGVKLKWNAVKGVKNYKVYRKGKRGTWQSVGVTDRTEFLDRSVKEKQNYTYTVRCVATDKKTTISNYDKKGLKIYYKKKK